MGVRLGFARASFAVTAALVCPCVPAHQDVIVNISRSGRLVGLPDRYQPARLEIPRGHDSQAHARLQLATHVLELPSCISALFRETPRSHVRASASWYHDRQDVPYYLLLRLSASRSRSGPFDGWALLFNLDTAELMRVSRMSRSHGGLGQAGEEIDLSTICSSKELARLVPSRAR
jgi:hypothetical protein